MYSIRLANQQDAKYLPAVEKSAAQTFLGHEKFGWIAQGDGQTEKDHLEFIQLQMEWIAVNNSDEPIGFINFEKHENSLHICELSVCQQWQGKGIGKQLIKQVFNTAVNLGIARITLTTFCEIPWNAPYYQRLGFSIIEKENLISALQKIVQHELDIGFEPQDRCAMEIILI